MDEPAEQQPDPDGGRRQRVALGMALAIASASLAWMVLLQFVLPPPGNAPRTALLIGRFHPLVVHLPIGLLLLLSLSEVLGFRRRVPPLGQATVATLWLTALGAVGAYSVGLLLSMEGGYDVSLVRLHQRLAAAVVVGSFTTLIAWLHTARSLERGRARWVYRVALGATTLTLGAGAHFGGSLTHGSTFLTEYLPGKPGGNSSGHMTMSSNSSGSKDASKRNVFDAVIAPILAQKCTGCHGAEKSKNRLRLDSLAAIEKGGKGGPVVVPGNAAKSPLALRPALPIEDERHMPPEGKPQLTANELAVVRLWIDAGALPALALEDAPIPASLLPWVNERVGGVVTAASRAASPAASASQAADDTPAPERSSADPGAPPPQSAALKPASGGAELAWDVIVGPVLAARCVRCHGPAKSKSGLRLDSYDGVLRGGADGPAITPDRPGRSPLLRRIRLPLTDDDHMPPSDEIQPSRAELDILLWWIQKGATRQLRVDAGGLSTTAITNARKALARAPRVAAETSPPSMSAGVAPSNVDGSATDDAGSPPIRHAEAPSVVGSAAPERPAVAPASSAVRPQPAAARPAAAATRPPTGCGGCRAQGNDFEPGRALLLASVLAALASRRVRRAPWTRARPRHRHRPTDTDP